MERAKFNTKSDLIQIIISRKLGLFGNVCKMNNDRKIKSVMLGIWMGRDDGKDLNGSGQRTSGFGANNRNLQTFKAPLERQVQGTSSFTRAATNQRVYPKGYPE